MKYSYSTIATEEGESKSLKVGCPDEATGASSNIKKEPKKYFLLALTAGLAVGALLMGVFSNAGNSSVGMSKESEEERLSMLARVNSNQQAIPWWPTRSLSARIKGAFTESGENIENFRASVRAIETGPGKAKWTVEITGGVEEVKAACPGNLNWHIHVKQIGTKSDADPYGCYTTGGHWDSGFACGGASEWAKTTCKSLNVGYESAGFSPYSARCGTSPSSSPDFPKQDGCEYGDLSGKMGKIEVKKGKQTFDDTFIQPLDTYTETSVVLHCCDANCKWRLACADF